MFLPFSWRDKQDTCSDFAVRHGDRRVKPQVWYMKVPLGKNETGKFLKTAADKASLQRQGSKVTNQCQEDQHWPIARCKYSRDVCGSTKRSQKSSRPPIIQVSK